MIKQLAIVMSVLLVACAGQSTREVPTYYLLEALPATPLRGAPRDLSIAFGPIEVAEYLDQSLLVSRRGVHELHLHNQHRWAMPLARNISGVLRAASETLLPGSRTSAWPAASRVPFDWRVAVEIVRLDGRPGAAVELIANWRVYSAADEPVRALGGQASLQGTLAEPGMGALVAGEAALLTELAARITAQLSDNLP